MQIDTFKMSLQQKFKEIPTSAAQNKKYAITGVNEINNFVQCERHS